MAIDWNFLQKVEGKENTAYVPQKNGKAIQNSGVTIGTGVDLGQQTKARFQKLGVPQELIDKLSPFFGKTQDKALKALDKAGEVTLSDEEIFTIDEALKKETLRETKAWYNKNNTLGQDWSDLSDRQQTVVLSVRYNHGPKGAPNFYKQVENGKWSDAIENLRSFYSSEDNELHSRRVKEAQYLAGLSGPAVDGIDGPQTAAAVEQFKNTVGVSTPDQVQPEQPQIGSAEYLDNLMQTLRAKLEGPQRGSQTPSRGDTEAQPTESEDAAQSRWTETEEALINAAVNAEAPVTEKVVAEEGVEEEKAWTPLEEQLIQRATGTVETEEPVRVEDKGEEFGDKDPIFGIF